MICSYAQRVKNTPARGGQHQLTDHGALVPFVNLGTGGGRGHWTQQSLCKKHKTSNNSLKGVARVREHLPHVREPCATRETHESEPRASSLAPRCDYKDMLPALTVSTGTSGTIVRRSPSMVLPSPLLVAPAEIEALVVSLPLHVSTGGWKNAPKNETRVYSSACGHKRGM